MPYYYLSLQYSAIQKTVLRHDRLWSIAGISQIMAGMNELEMAGVKNAKILVAGGGKFTARFDSTEDAQKAREYIIELVSTTLPMLEFQVSDIVEAESFKDAKEKGIIRQLVEQKKRFRGYGVSFNPHLKTCPECGEYPSVATGQQNPKETKDFCSICLRAYQKARINLNSTDELTTLERIYKRYLQECYNGNKIPEIPYNFEDLLPSEKKGEKDKRMAVWFSDLNNMNQKVPIWLSEGDDDIPKIFSMIKDLNVDIISETLIKTFNKIDGEYLPFRLIVAGGDDLRIVMAEEYIFDFVLNLSEILNKKIDNISKNGDERYKYITYITTEWLENKRGNYLKNKGGYKKANEGFCYEEDLDRPIKPYSFGGAFAVTSIHTPFKKIHEACEDMMGEAKKSTDRMGNSVNWSVLSIEEPATNAENKMEFDKPLFIEDKDCKNGGLSFRTYIKMRDFYSGIMSGSHIQQIASKIMEFKNDSLEVERWLKQQASATLKKSFEFILVDRNFKEGLKEDGTFNCKRLATLLELLRISKKE